MKPEKRCCVRFTANESAFAAIGERYDVVGRIKDVSLSGVSVEYLGSKICFDTAVSVAVFTSNDKFYLPGLKGKIVYNHGKAPQDDGSSFLSNCTYSRCGIQFREMKKEQNQKLNDFIESFTSSNQPKLLIASKL